MIRRTFDRFFDDWLFTFPSFVVHCAIFVVWMLSVEVYPWSYLLIGVSLYSILLTIGLGISARHGHERVADAVKTEAQATRRHTTRLHEGKSLVGTPPQGGQPTNQASSPGWWRGRYRR